MPEYQALFFLEWVSHNRIGKIALRKSMNVALKKKICLSPILVL